MKQHLLCENFLDLKQSATLVMSLPYALSATSTTASITLEGASLFISLLV